MQLNEIIINNLLRYLECNEKKLKSSNDINDYINYLGKKTSISKYRWKQLIMYGKNSALTVNDIDTISKELNITIDDLINKINFK